LYINILVERADPVWKRASRERIPGCAPAEVAVMPELNCPGDPEGAGREPNPVTGA